MLVLSIAGLNAIEKWKQLVGPNKILREEWFFPYSVRTRFGLREDYPDVLHASENALDSKNENIYFFPRSISYTSYISFFNLLYIFRYLRTNYV